MTLGLWVAGVVGGSVGAILTTLLTWYVPTFLRKDMENSKKELYAYAIALGVPSSNTHGHDGTINTVVKGQKPPPMYTHALNHRPLLEDLNLLVKWRKNKKRDKKDREAFSLWHKEVFDS